jgi:outer membrane protein
MNRKIVLVACFLCFLFGEASGQKRWTLPECLAFAQKNNLQAQQSRLLRDKSLLQLGSARNLFLPEIDMRLKTTGNLGFIVDPTNNNVYRNKGVNLGNQASLNANLDLFTGFARTNGIKLRTQELAADNYAYEAILNYISLQVTFAYLQVLLSQEQRQNTQQRLGQLENQQKLVAAQVQQGVLNKRDLLNIQSQMAAEALLVVYAENAINQTIFDLMLAMGLQENELIRVDSLNLSHIQLMPALKLDEVMTASSTALPDMKAALAKVEAANYSLQISRASFLPTLSLTAQAGTRTSNFKNDTFDEQLTKNMNQQLGLVLYVPIFNRFSFRNTTEMAKLDLVSSKIAYQQADTELKRKVRSAFLDYQAAFKKYQALQKQYEAVSEEFRYVEKMLKLGGINAVEYGVTRTQFVTAQSDLLQAKYDCFFKWKMLDFYQGKPLEF